MRSFDWIKSKLADLRHRLHGPILRGVTVVTYTGCSIVSTALYFLPTGEESAALGVSSTVAQAFGYAQKGTFLLLLPHYLRNSIRIIQGVRRYLSTSRIAKMFRKWW
jgi:hypothetical protein